MSYISSPWPGRGSWRQKDVGSISWLRTPNFHSDNFTIFYFFHFYFGVFQSDACLTKNVRFGNTKAIELQEELGYSGPIDTGGLHLLYWYSSTHDHSIQNNWLFWLSLTSPNHWLF